MGEGLDKKPHGYGIMFYKNGNIEYEGDFIDGKYEGNGTHYNEDGEYYIGQWKNGLVHGKGIVYYKNGKIKYEGELLNGKREGYGKFFYAEGGYYIGQLSNN